MTSKGYEPGGMEAKWQRRWDEEGVFRTHRDRARPKFYCYEFPPFPSGSLHMGHVRNYVIGDATARFKRLMGFNVLYAQGFDSLGLPVEDAALQAGQTPQEWTDRCIAKMKRGLLQLGLSYDSSRFVSYHDPEYYRGTQWIFLKLYEAGLIYRAETWVSWCDTCQTALAAELIEEGRCWRCGSRPGRVKRFQWFANVQRVAPKLFAGLESVKMAQSARATQQNWIGRKEGVFVSIEIEGLGERLEMFTTRIELLYGATVFALAPEHPLLPALLAGAPDEEALLQRAETECALPRIERMKDGQSRGFDTHRFGIHPLTGARIPIYVAPFVLPEFGTGAVLVCPGHGKSDFDFAREMGLPVMEVVVPPPAGPPSQPPSSAPLTVPYLDAGVMVNSGPYDGLSTAEAAESLAADLIAAGCARSGVSFSVKNWCISRQRYWSVPIPIVYCDDCGTVPVREQDLPVELPRDGVELGGVGNPLDSHAEFTDTACPECGGGAQRETSTLDTFVNSSWAYLRYCNVDAEQVLFDTSEAEYWMPCDIGIGGSEQVTVGNFYFRVIYNMLHEVGVVRESEPWATFLFHGLVMKDGQKMSKSVGNIVEPAALIDEFGVDAVRFCILSMARPVRDVNWGENMMRHGHRFLTGVWALALEIADATGTFDETERDELVPQTQAQRRFSRFIEVAIHRVREFDDQQQFQRSCRELILYVQRIERFWRRAQRNLDPLNRGFLHKSVETLLVLLNPIAPHICEELWERFGNTEMICVGAHLQT